MAESYVNADPKTMSQWSQLRDTSQLQRMEKEIPCQIGFNRSSKAQLKNHLQLKQQDVQPEFSTLAQKQMLSQRVSIICSLTSSKIPIVKFAR